MRDQRQLYAFRLEPLHAELAVVTGGSLPTDKMPEAVVSHGLSV
jgi:hypothetical protein